MTVSIHFCICQALAGKDVEKEEHSSIAGGIANLYIYSGNQFDGLSEN